MFFPPCDSHYLFKYLFFKFDRRLGPIIGFKFSLKCVFHLFFLFSSRGRFDSARCPCSGPGRRVALRVHEMGGFCCLWGCLAPSALNEAARPTTNAVSSAAPHAGRVVTPWFMTTTGRLAGARDGCCPRPPRRPWTEAAVVARAGAVGRSQRRCLFIPGTEGPEEGPAPDPPQVRAASGAPHQDRLGGSLQSRPAAAPGRPLAPPPRPAAGPCWVL